MTNGEKLCYMFPEMHYTLSEKQPRRVVTTIGVCASFDLDWWNAEYKEPTTKNDLGVDCIDRRATLDAIIKRLGIKNEAYLLEAERVIYQQILAMPSVTPQEPILDKIRAEIEQQEKWLMIAGYNAYNADIAFNAIKSEVAKYKAESEADNGNE